MQPEYLYQFLAFAAGGLLTGIFTVINTYLHNKHQSLLEHNRRYAHILEQIIEDIDEHHTHFLGVAALDIRELKAYETN